MTGRVKTTKIGHLWDYSYSTKKINYSLVKTHRIQPATKIGHPETWESNNWLHMDKPSEIKPAVDKGTEFIRFAGFAESPGENS